jgi:hypothetical protein
MDRIPPLLAVELKHQYDVLRMLGEGGMGTVWLARERSLDRLVAIKVLSSESLQIADLRDRFRREARIAARLMHAHIVPLHAFGETADALYLVMGYVEGESLATRLEREGRLPRAVTLRMLSEISDALAFAHKQGVVHRDVKPDNILIEAGTGRALLADFGIARAPGGETSMTMTGIAMGTPSFMSPEQATGEKEVDGRSDVYSLCVVGYRMLAGKLPFAGTSLQSLMAQHVAQKPDDLALAVSRPDRGVARVVMRGLEKDPAMRWSRAEHLRDMLRTEAETAPELPEELDRIEGAGTMMLAPILVTISVALWLGLASRDLGTFLVWQLVFTGALATTAAVQSRPAIKSFGLLETLRTLFYAPRFWSSWWPRALRRTDDQWDRLPASLRRFRLLRDATVTLLVLHSGIIAPVLVILAFRFQQLEVLGSDAGFLATTVCVLGLAGGGTLAAFVAGRIARRDLMRLGLSAYEAKKAGTIPNVASHPQWKNPQFSRLLGTPAEEALEQHTPQSPAELLDAIEDLNGRLRRGGILADNDCVSAARNVKIAIDALEADVMRMNQELDPAENDRMARRLGSLGSGEEESELRRLLESQRDVLVRLDSRRKEKEARRDGLRDQLMTLWMQLLDIHARTSRGSPADPELTGQMRALSSDLARAGEGLAEAERVLGRPPSGRVLTPT